jgi:hypothetical protein
MTIVQLTRRILNGWVLAAGLLVLAPPAIAGDLVTIEGTITESGSGAPLEGVTVVVSGYGLAWESSTLEQTTTSAVGTYSVSISMNPGQTWNIVVEAAGPSHAPARYNGSSEIGCYFRCGGTSGMFSVSAGDTISSVEFELDPIGGTIAGTITDAGNGSELPSAYVEPLSATGVAYSQHFHGVSDSSGNYQLPLALPPGEYHLRSGPGPGDNYVIQAWQGFSCQHDSCPILNTDTVNVSAGEVTADINFALQPGATLSGTLEPAADLWRLPRLFDAIGGFLDGQIYLQEGQSEWHFDGLSGGSYYLEVRSLSESPFIRKLHNGLPCPVGGCNRARGNPLTVQPGATKTGIDLTLELGGSLSGTIVDAATQAPPPVTVVGTNTHVGHYDVINADGTVVGGGLIIEDEGDVKLAPSSGIPPGDYYVRTYNDWLNSGIGSVHPSLGRAVIEGFSDAVYPDIPCAGLDCDLAAATPITISESELTEITIEIKQGSNISGSIIDQDTGALITNAVVKLVDAQNRKLAATHTDESGEFAFGAFPSGEYYLRTAMSSIPGPGSFSGYQNPYFDRVHGSTGRCSELLCEPISGTAITLDGNNDADPIILEVETGPVIRGQIIEVSTGLPINGGYVQVFNDQGRLVGEYKVNTVTSYYQTTALEAGTYTLSPVVSPAYNAVPQSSSSASSSQLMSSHETGGNVLTASGTSITIGKEDVQANTGVVDSFLDTVFISRFME